MTEAIWIKDPMAILADGAERGVVVKDGAIVELVPKGREPATAAAQARSAARAGPSPRLSRNRAWRARSSASAAVSASEARTHKERRPQARLSTVSLSVA